MFINGNGDTNQLPNIDGSDVFVSPLVLFCFKAHFLHYYVRMMDPTGKELLEMMSTKPISQEDIEKKSKR